LYKEVFNLPDFLVVWESPPRGVNHEVD
jgi:hypothetical protein